MAFAWTQDISQYSNIEAQDVNEIRTVTDYVQNNNAYHSTYYSSHLTTNYGANNPAYDYYYGGYYPGGGD